jgi:hypothetical protein
MPISSLLVGCVGDFRSIEEADAAMRRLKATGVFKEVSIVREQINIPLD